MKIMLDAGHGKNTAGKRTPDDSMREFVFNHAVAEYAKTMLLNYENIKVEYAHDSTGNIDVPLYTRTQKANNWPADIYISIHANASGDSWSTANGIETFHHPKSSEASKKLAAALQNKLIEKTKLRNRGVKQADFQVVRETKMPAALIECGFMSNKEEAALLKSDSYRKLCAEAIVEAIVQMYSLKKKQVIVPTSTSIVAPIVNENTPDTWAANAWEWAKNNGLTDGSRPKDEITRQEMILILKRFADYYKL